MRILPILYEFLQSFFVAQKHKRLQKMIESCKIPVPCRVLDVGCGTGQAAPLFKDRETFEYLGIEVSEDCVKRAKDTMPDLSFRLLNIIEQPLNEPSFDLILVDCVLHHLTDEMVMDLFEKVCMKVNFGGTLIIQDMLYPANRMLMQRLLVALDRGKYCRKRSHLLNLVGERLSVIQEVTYKIYTYDMCLLRCSCKR